MFKNSIVWGVLFFFGGMVVGGLGWDKYESTEAARSQGSVIMIVIGVAMILIGLSIFRIKGNKK